MGESAMKMETKSQENSAKAGKLSLSNLQIRIISAAIYLPLLLLSAWDGEVFSVLIYIVALGAWHEFLSFRRGRPETRSAWVWHGLAMFWGGLPILGLLLPWSYAASLVGTAVIFQILVTVYLCKAWSFADLWTELQYYVFGFLYVTGLFFCLIQLQSQIGGKEAIWFLFLVVGATDTGAYFAGKSFGSTPFFSNLSPSKTREGFLGGLFCGILAALGLSLLLPWLNFYSPAPIFAVLIGALVSVASTFGDLIESAIKRAYSVKDSGSLIPGHGGVLDRFDGVIFAALPLFLIVIVLGGFYTR